MTLTKTIGELEPVPVRDVWRDEARDLTPWLAEYLEALGRALGMDLELDGSEVAVGPFSADLLLHDANTGKHVVVENMFGNTDHGHLGKIITYAAGLGASHAVLIAETFRQEHRSALQWLIPAHLTTIPGRLDRDPELTGPPRRFSPSSVV